MNQKPDYLTDEELLLLIAEVEENDLVSAPPDLAERIAKEIQTARPPMPGILSMEQKRREYRAYCFRVITSVAAAIALVFLLPQTVPAVQREPERGRIPIAQGRYESKEEALGHPNVLAQKLGGTTWFEFANQWDIFENLNGGLKNETMQEK